MSWWNRHRVRLPAELLERARQHAAQAGYASVEEFVEHCVNRELDGRREADAEVLRARLRGLGYVD